MGILSVAALPSGPPRTWVQRHPMRTLRLADRWHRLLATVRWIDERQLPGMYVRQLDVPGVDTKFIERNRGVLTELLDLQLPSGRVDFDAGDFERRYGFRRKPGYVRFRADDCHGWRELTVRAEDFAAPPAGITRAYVLENEITYLAAPCPRRAMLVLGGGYAVPVLESLGWLADLDLVYWGDIDHTDSPSWIGCGRGFLASGPCSWIGRPCSRTAISGSPSRARLRRAWSSSTATRQRCMRTSWPTALASQCVWSRNA